MTAHKKSTSLADQRIGQRIRLRRLSLGLSQGSLAEALGLTFQQIQKYEKGANRVSASRLEDIAQILKVPVAFFYDESAETQDALLLGPDTPQSLSLLKAFTAITHPGLQKQAVALVRAIAGLKAGQGVD